MSTFVSPGLDELRATLRALPADLAAEARGIVLEHAERAEDEVYAAYPEVSGTLRNDLRVDVVDGGDFGAAARVVNTAKDAWFFENGTQVRHTSFGANRGQMPAAHVFVPRMITWRARMWAALADMVRAHGITVSGTP